MRRGLKLHVTVGKIERQCERLAASWTLQEIGSGCYESPDPPGGRASWRGRSGRRHVGLRATARC